MSPILQIILVALLVVLVIYQIRMDQYNRQKMFELQLEMAKGQQAMTKELPWKDIKEIINDIISFNVSKYIRINGLMKMKTEELSIMWTMMVGDLCTKIDLAIGDEIKRQSYKSISEDYFRQYVKDAVELTIVYQLENNRNNNFNNRLEMIQQNVAKQSATLDTDKNTKK